MSQPNFYQKLNQKFEDLKNNEKLITELTNQNYCNQIKSIPADIQPTLNPYKMSGEYFSLKVFFILLRETFESAIVISILLSFLKQNFTKQVVNNNGTTPATTLTIDKKVYRRLQLQVWLGGFFGLFICLLIGSVFVALFYIIGENYWTKYERNWEAIFSVISSLIISVMGLSLLRINQMQKKWQVKLGQNMRKQFKTQENELIDNHNDDGLEVIMGDEINGITHKRKSKGLKQWLKNMSEKHSLMILPMVTLLREGLEAIFVISGVSASEPASTLPLSIITAIGLGSLIGFSLYKGGNKMRLQIFLIFSTCFLYLVSAGLMSRGVWFFELEQYVQKCHGQDMSEVGNGPGSYDVTNTIWHVNCCSGLNDGGWMLLNALLGWTNTATYGSIISYNVYWLFIVLLLNIKLYQERNGYVPLIPIKWQLKKIVKRYEIIKYNLENNVNYTQPQVELQQQGGPSGNSGGSGIVSSSNGYNSVHGGDSIDHLPNTRPLNVISDDETSEATTSLLTHSQFGDSR